MRTTKLLLTAALGVVGAASAFAQVYSVNTVGYVNVPLKGPMMVGGTEVGGWNLIANPLDNKNPNGNTVENLLASVPDGTTIFLYRGGFVDSTKGLIEPGVWTTEGLVLAPGEGFWISAAANSTVTFVGDVMQGVLSNPIPRGLSMRGSMVPQRGLLETELGWPGVDGDQIFTYTYASTGVPGFGTYNRGLIEPNTWDEQPVIDVGQGFWSVTATDKDHPAWVRDFKVQ